MAKTVNYTPEQTELMVGMYLGVRDESEARRDEVVNEICDILGKQPRSVRAKLARETVNGEAVYIAKQVVSKVTGDSPAKKLELAETLRKVSGANINPETVAKANKTDIVRLIEAFNSRDEVIAILAADEMEDETEE